MYDYLKGKLTFVSQNKITIDVNGVGYSLLMPFNSFSKLPAAGSEILVHTALVIKEDSHTLFGFLERKEKKLFETLINISGIGPKTGLAIIGHIDYEHFFLAIAKADLKMLSKIPGLGKKSVERLIIEMRGKVKNLQGITLTSAPLEKGPAYDAVSALMNLGYSAADAQNAVQKALSIVTKKDKDKNNKKNKANQKAVEDVGEIIALALRQK